MEKLAQSYVQVCVRGNVNITHIKTKIVVLCKNTLTIKLFKLV